jgi:hypothetical protein
MKPLVALCLAVVSAGLGVSACSTPAPLPANFPDTLAKASVQAVLVAASTTSTTSFRGVSPADLQLPRYPGVIATQGASTGYSNNHSVVSVDLCSDGPNCRVLVAAMRGNPQNCWFGREVLGPTPLPNGVQLGWAYAQSVGQGSCTAKKAPASGWESKWPQP